MNWYVYTGNDPVNYVDLWGLVTEDATKEEYLSGINLSYSRDEKAFYWMPKNGTVHRTPIDDAFAGGIPGFDVHKDRNYFQKDATTDMLTPVMQKYTVAGMTYQIPSEEEYQDEQGGLWERDIADRTTDAQPKTVLNFLKKLGIKINHHDNDSTIGFRGKKGTPTEGMQICFDNETKERVTGEFQGTYDYGDSYKTHKKYDINPHNEDSDYREF